MKALTVRQPWAWAIFHAGKDVENRKWSPWRSICRGETIAVHVSKAVAKPWAEACSVAVHRSHGDRAVPADLVELMPPGHVVGLVDVLTWTETGPSERGWIDGAYRWHWLLQNPRLIVPQPYVGRLGLWTVEGLQC